MSFRLTTIALLVAALFTAGCDSALSRLSDNELQDRMYECRNAHKQSPGSAISCDNFERECKRRRSAGKFVC